jgi:hypothetical protein
LTGVLMQALINLTSMSSNPAVANTIAREGHCVDIAAIRARAGVHECDQAGRDEIPEECIDPPGVDRAAIHREIGDAALRFFGTALGT